jgi:hypothetical protein
MKKESGLHHKSQIIFTHIGGRFANQLMVFGHLIALAEEDRDLSICNFSFWPYARYCAGTERNPLCLYPPRKSRFAAVGRVHEVLYRVVPDRFVPPLSRGLAHTMHALAPSRALDHKNEVVDLSHPSVRRQFHSHPWSLCAGWKLRDWDAFERHSHLIRNFLKPAERFAAPSRAFMQTIRKESPFVIGLLMRQTDYRRWADGKYFFPAATYRRVIDALWERFGSTAHILVTSDERQDRSLFKHPNIHWATGTAGRGHFMESFTQLSMCDLVVSVPSTFATWAAFLGNTSLLCCADNVSGLLSEPIMSNPLLEARTHVHYGQSMFW